MQHATPGEEEIALEVDSADGIRVMIVDDQAAFVAVSIEDVDDLADDVTACGAVGFLH